MASPSGCSATQTPSCSCSSQPIIGSGLDDAPPQFALLDMFFPGFSIFSRAVEKYFKVDLNLYIPLVVFLGGIAFAWRYFANVLWSQLESHFMSTMDMRTDDEVYNMLMAWVAQQRFSQAARRFVVNTNLNSRSYYLWFMDEDDGDDEDLDYGGDSSPLDGKTKKKALAYTPTFGNHYFFYKGRLCIFRRDKAHDQQGILAISQREEISISCFGRGPSVLKELLLEARMQYLQRDEHKTLIYRGTRPAGSMSPTWQRCLARARRPFSTVILNEKVKQDLIDDITDYLDPATRRWYSNRGIPYRRGYLLYGPPGTGKSSLSLALAGFFKMRIYIVSLNSTMSNEENLGTLFAELPRRCVVLLEDIDTAGLTHTREEGKAQNGKADDKADDMVPGQLTKGNGNTNDDSNNNNSRLSLSGLLNILDGVASQEGRVLIMTTNHMEKLDKALIRPGRVDMVVEFGLADTDMIAAIYRAIFAPLEGDDSPPPGARDLAPQDLGKRVAAEQARRDEAAERVDRLAVEFAARVPAHEFSPAELQGYLMRRKRDPEAAVEGAEQWVAEIRRGKAAKRVREAEERRKKEEEEKKDEGAKAEEKENKKKAGKDERRKRREKGKRNHKPKPNKSGRRSKQDGSVSSSVENFNLNSCSDSGSFGSESQSEKKQKGSQKENIEVKIKVDKASDTDGDGDGLKAPVSAATGRSDGFIDVKKECADGNQPRTRGTDSGYGTA